MPSIAVKNIHRLLMTLYTAHPPGQAIKATQFPCLELYNNTCPVLACLACMPGVTESRQFFRRLIGSMGWAANIWSLIALILFICTAWISVEAVNIAVYCKNKIGLFASPDGCDKYVVCFNGLGWQQPCLDGLHFDKTTKVCTFASTAGCQVPAPAVEVKAVPTLPPATTTTTTLTTVTEPKTVDEILTQNTNINSSNYYKYSENENGNLDEKSAAQFEKQDDELSDIVLNDHQGTHGSFSGQDSLQNIPHPVTSFSLQTSPFSAHQTINGKPHFLHPAAKVSIEPVGFIGYPAQLVHNWNTIDHQYRVVHGSQYNPKNIEIYPTNNNGGGGGGHRYNPRPLASSSFLPKHSDPGGQLHPFEQGGAHVGPGTNRQEGDIERHHGGINNPQRDINRPHRGKNRPHTNKHRSRSSINHTPRGTNRPYRGRNRHGPHSKRPPPEVFQPPENLKGGFGGQDQYNPPSIPVLKDMFNLPVTPPFGPPPHPDFVGPLIDFGRPIHLLFNGEELVSEAQRQLDAAARESRLYLDSKLADEAERVRSGRGFVDSKSYQYVSAFSNAKPYVKQLSFVADILLQTCRIIKERFHIDRSQILDVMTRIPSPIPPNPNVHLPDTPLSRPSRDVCPYPKNFQCDDQYRYRSFDGCCNNPQYPGYGRAMIPHARLVAPQYGDGVDTLRRAKNGQELPSGREVSLRLFQDINRPSNINTLMVMTFGQFVDHDLSRSAATKISVEASGLGKMEEVKCGSDGCETGQKGLEACVPIKIPAGDPDFGNKRCLKFVRTQEVPALECGFGFREQLNQITSWIDASQVYGSSKEESDSIREFSDPRRGRMKLTPHPHGASYKWLLPKDDVDLCRDVNSTIKCFMAGDERVNEQAALTAMHTIWVREHNHIEDMLFTMNPHWGGEKLFQETRRIIGAMNQHIIFNELLPVILGKDVIRREGLELQDTGYYGGYNPAVDPGIPNAFATAAFRFGHTLIQDILPRANRDHSITDRIMLSSAFRRPVHIYDSYRGGVDSIITGMCDMPAQTYDRFFTKQVTRHLFAETPPFGLGMDLTALNIQRGRDHGIPGYNFYRKFCGLRYAHSFEDFTSDFADASVIQELKKLYKHPDDVDLFVGGILETSVPGGIVGPTFACIIARTFKNVRDGDRFWYENPNAEGFTPAQLQEIRKISLARVVCDNLDNIDTIQPFILLQPFKAAFENFDVDAASKAGIPQTLFRKLYQGDFNKRVSCNQIPYVDLTVFMDTFFKK
ncbi:peroxidasin homolog isoform X2 [Lingula anatina]|uniref:Peroxidasin homolog isoform X2 n=1 Tax=Lingula anatina TaxID=7574 RepID=A0A1S3IUL8_LINAN|nr:peroxidasin homolog isoform X2 [Lingula anatina]|eukprot:XP_013401626.1 peroxidasin homolog isoform X2 [Lingula anatina]